LHIIQGWSSKQVACIINPQYKILAPSSCSHLNQNFQVLRFCPVAYRKALGDQWRIKQVQLYTLKIGVLATLGCLYGLHAVMILGM
jgi:hypothetical protein